MLIFLLTISLLHPRSSSAGNTTQAGALESAAKTQREAADRSLEGAVVLGMRALTEMGKFNMRSAINNGVEGYRKYEHSIHLDESAWKAERSGQLLGASAAKGPTSPPLTSFSRLKESFLKSGEAAKVSEEFRKVTGMSGEIFLRHLGRATDQPLYLTDPAMPTKFAGRIEALIKDMPASSGRDLALKGFGTIKGKAFDSLVSKTIAMVASSNKEGVLAESQSAARPGAPALPAVAAGASSPKEELPGASATGSDQTPEQLGKLSSPSAVPAQGKSSLALTEFIRASREVIAEQDTIFAQVRRRYRAIISGWENSPH